MVANYKSVNVARQTTTTKKMKRTTAQKDTTESDTTTKEKLFTVKCKLNDGVTYAWNRNIERDTENNNALVKCSPSFMMAVQSIKPELTNARAIKQFICSTLGIDWQEDYDYFSDKARETKIETVAQADKTDAEVNAYVYKLQKSGKKDKDIVFEMLSNGYTKDQIKTAFKKDTEREAEKLKATKEAEELIKELSL